MDKDINFAIAILKHEYKNRRDGLVNLNLTSREKDNVLVDLEKINASIFKIEQAFKEKTE